MNVAPEEIDLKNFKTNRGKHGFTNEERRAFQELIKIKMIDTFRDKHPTEQKYSWFSSFAKSRERNVGWRIDMFLITKKLQNKVIIADIMDKDKWLFSDHIPVILELSF
jgi:exodeoxyribonuclease-3